MICILTCAPGTALAGFDWGGDCDGGKGSFTSAIPYRDTLVVGTIPTTKKDVRIALESPVDTDVQLIDVATGHAIIAWPHGDLNGATQACTWYHNVQYCYSGYNGDGQNLGHEWIEIRGTTNRELEMRAYGYQAGQADITYSFSASPTCNEIGSGLFVQPISQNATIEVGEIPAGKVGVVIELQEKMGRDVDVQLHDATTGTAIIAWPNGLLSGATEQSVTYAGMTIRYSGYNGVNNNWGHERIEIEGEVTRTLVMKAFGYQAGTADVTYSWGKGVGATCMGIASLTCEPGLVCKEVQTGVSDPAGACHTETWCLNDATAATECSNLAHPATPGAWGCERFTCVWKEAGGEITTGQLESFPAQYDGQTVTITDVLQNGPAMCTKMACSIENPCCNQCGAQSYFAGTHRQITLNGLGCSGNECSIYESCDYAANTRVRVTGRVEHNPTYNTLTLHVTDHAPAESLSCSLYNATCPTGYTCQIGCPTGQSCGINPPGVCMKSCTSPNDCSASEYCSEEGLCRSDASCGVDLDCRAKGNDWSDGVMCIATTVVTPVCDEGACATTCVPLSP